MNIDGSIVERCKWLDASFAGMERRLQEMRNELGASLTGILGDSSMSTCPSNQTEAMWAFVTGLAGVTAALSTDDGGEQGGGASAGTSLTLYDLSTGTAEE